MSLDICLYGPATTTTCTCSDCGNEHSRETRESVFEANVTHNLSNMAAAAGVYEALWSPETIGATKASDLIDRLRAGMRFLHMDPSRFRAFNPPNGWGTYDGLTEVVRDYLAACEAHPDAEISVSK